MTLGMARVHLFEWEDQPWFPDVLRRGMTDFLAFAGRATTLPYRGFVQRLGAALQASGERKLLDLCSGGSGPIQPLLRLLEEQGLQVTATLTDLYPNLDSFRRVKEQSGGRIDYLERSVDATHVPPELEGFRLLSNAFHHLRPEVARKVLADAVAARRGIALFEATERTAQTLLSVALLVPLQVLLATPFIRPFRWSRLLFTYPLPLIPFFSLWDGIVSCLRSYSVPELKALVESLGETGYRWEIERLRVGRTPMHVLMLIGTPPAA